METKKEKSTRIKTKRRAHLPKMPFHNIAISLSGGGFRATCLHLGVLSYLHSVKLFNVSLLERVRVLSTVSAGTLAGLKYASTLKKGGTFEDCYKSLLEFMTKKDLVEDALQHLSEDKNWNAIRKRSLINAFASIYHKAFESETFGLLWEESPAIHLKEISFNATEFNFALPFHFQKTEKLHSKTGLDTHTYIGNKKIHIPIEIAKEIRLADIIAASSCFPFGFEPINFPDDFIYDGAEKLKDFSLLPHNVYDGEKIEYPIGLMDGGVDDNQGVDSIINAEERMKNYPDELKEFRSHDKKAVDLYILSDGTNPTMQSYTRSNKDKIPYIGNWSFKLLRYFGIISSIVGLSAIISAFYLESKTGIILLSVLGTLGILVAFFFLVFSRGIVGLSKRAGVPSFFLTRLFHVDKLKFATLNNLLVNRRNSVTKMITKVFIKQMRWFSFERVYSDPAWRLRLIMNAVFELTADEVEKRKSKHPYLSTGLLNPGGDIMAVSEKSLKMGTTLWFVPEELKGEKNMPNTIIACGQFTICFNLIKYFEKFIYHPRYKNDYEKYSAETKEELALLYSNLMSDWEKFRKNPYWMVEKLNKKVGCESNS
ncbi:MAG: patatin-like phospholipase family protein [Bacteroidia bacterium]